MRSRPRAMPPFVLLVLALTGCSSFERDWRTFDGAAVASSGLEGRWRGVWFSRVNGHDGGLRCIVTRDAEGGLVARYHATYGGIFTFEYAVPLEVERDGERDGEGWRFTGEADLGWLAGGRYAYEGVVVGEDFRATYRCDRDRGLFRLRRVK